MDGDGLGDILIGARNNASNGSDAGKAYLILGASLGTTSEIDLSQADYSFLGENVNNHAGYAVSTAGDVDGDGLDDILIGAFHNNDGGLHAGKAYLILGASLGMTSEIDLSQADYSFIGENAGDAFGLTLSSAEDVDGDGLDDILITAFSNDDGGLHAGKAYLILGASLGSVSEIDASQADYSFIGEKERDNLYQAVSAGDVDGDGLADILMGATGNDDGGDRAGKAYVILASSLGTTSTIDLSQADYSFIGEGTENWAGDGIAGLGDVDGDGLSDITISAFGNNDGGSRAGKVYIILGSSLGNTSTIDLSQADMFFLGESYDQYLGYWRSLDYTGDVNGDGKNDIIMSANGSNTAGKSYLFLGCE